MHLFDLLSILLRCNDFAGIQKSVVEQMGSRSSNSDHDFFFFHASLALESALELLQEQPHIQGVVAEWVQEGLEELIYVQGQEGRQ